MERAAYLKTETSYPLGNITASDPKRQSTLIIIIILFHVVGLIGFSIPFLRPLFLKIGPWHLLLMLVVLIISHKPLNNSFLLFGAIVFITALIAEWVGIHKAWLFGNYAYGDTLGFKIDGVPLTIGINWFLLIYSTGVLLDRSRIKNSYSRIIIGALLLVLLDVLIEPIAIKFNYWHWTGNTIPLKNYACWFLLSALMLFVFEQFKFKRQSLVAPVFLLTQFVFFIVLLLL